jgi:hypothetical protein
MGTLKTTNIESISGSGTVTLGTSGETFTVPTGVTATGFNNPAFFAYKTGSTQSLVSGAVTKVTFDTELYDSDSDFATSTFTPTTAGKYFFTTSVLCGADAGTVRYVNAYIRKNGSTNFGTYSPEDNGNNLNGAGVSTSVTYDMNGSSDYVEVYAQCQGTSPLVKYDNNGFTTYFQGYRIGT